MFYCMSESRKVRDIKVFEFVFNGVREVWPVCFVIVSVSLFKGGVYWMFQLNCYEDG